MNKDILEEPDEDSSRAVHVLLWYSEIRKGILSGSPHLTARHNVVEDTRVERELEKEITHLWPAQLF